MADYPVPPDQQAPDIGSQLDPQQLTQMLQGANPIDNVSPPQSGGPAAGSLQQAMSDYAGWMLDRAKQLSQPQDGAMTRFRQGFGGGMMKAAGLNTPREENLQNFGAQDAALKGAVGVQNSGLQQQQLDLQKSMVTLPNGATVPLALAKTLFPAYVRGAATTGAAQIGADSREKIAGLKMMAESGKVAKWMPVQGENGVVMQGFDKGGQPIPSATVDNAVFPWLMQNTSNTIEYKETADGIVALPKTTVTSKQPIVGGGGKASGKGGGTVMAPSGGGLTAKPVTGVGGEPLMPKLTSSTRTMIEAAPKVISFVDRINALIDQQEKDLGPAKSRWSEFMAGKVGAPNPEFTKLRTNVGLLQTLLMRMHVGARGGEYIMKHFTDLMDSSKQSPENMRAAMGELKQYAQDLIAESQPPTPNGVLTLSDGGKTYRIPAALKANFLKDHPNAR